MGWSCRPGAWGARGGGDPSRYIKLTLGTKLARKLALSGEKVPVRMAFGTGADAGKILISVDVTAGTFVAKRDRRGRYSLTINAATAAGLFALEFPPMTIAEIEPRCRSGHPPELIFECSQEMLQVED